MADIYRNSSEEPIDSTEDLPSKGLYDLAYNDDINRSGKAFGRYEYNGILVPRVTTIIDHCYGNNESFKIYAARQGENYFSNKRYTLDIGTNTHAAIAEYLMYGTTTCLEGVTEGIDEVYNCVRNFINWHDHITKDLGWKVEIDLSEYPLVCPWFGGTLDAIMTINGRRYLVDFKSSKKIDSEYFIQASAYLWMINNYYPELQPISGIGIIRIDKYNKTYEDVFFDVDDPNDMMFILNCQCAFGEALKLFYSMNILDTDTKKACKDKKDFAATEGEKEAS